MTSLAQAKFYGTAPSLMDNRLTHLDEQGHAHMVEVGKKSVTVRHAQAQAWVTMGTATFDRLAQGDTPKGDVPALCRVAAIMAAKKTSELIPLCHPLQLTGIECDFILHPPNRVELRARVRCKGQTGVEMEALTAVSVAALTLYDMLKAADKGMQIGPIVLLSKEGGASGTWTRE